MWSYNVWYAFQNESTLYKGLHINELLARSRHHIWRLSDWNKTRTHHHLLGKRLFKHLGKLAKWFSYVVSSDLSGEFYCLSNHLMYAFPSESTFCKCLNVKELLAWSRHDICRLRDCKDTRTQNHLVPKQTLYHLAKLTKWLSCVDSGSLFGAFVCMFLSCQVCISEWTHTL